MNFSVTVIRVNEPEIRSRDSVRLVSDVILGPIVDIAGGNPIWLDLRDVYYVSRAAAEEFLRVEDELGIKLELINVSEGVKAMFDLVSKARHAQPATV